MALAALVDEIVAVHHVRLRKEVPRFTARMEALGSPKALTEPWRQMLEVLLPHLDREEASLFPLVKAIAAGETAGGEELAAGIHLARYEHDVFTTLENCVRAAAHLMGADESALLDLLDDLETHTRMEEDMLFPQALAEYVKRAGLKGASTELAGGLVGVVSTFEPEAPGGGAAGAPASSFQDPPGVRVIRHTRGRCSTCVSDVPARVVRDATEARLEKLCPTHGVTVQLLSRAPDDWEKLDKIYFRMNPESYPQRDYIVRMTEKCNLDCPICLAKANTEETPDLGLDRLRELLRGRRGVKIDLMAAEPTLREDIEEWIRTVKAAGCIAALHTNGLKLANREFAQRMKDAGVDEVFLQFDGQDDAANVVLRGRPLNKARLAALKNLRELGIATSLIVVIARGVNEAEVNRTVDFAMLPENRFIKEVFFLGLRMLGSARQAVNKDGDSLAGAMMMPDEIVDLLHAQRPEITREHVREFNELYFAMLSAFHVKKCLYVQHYMMVRDDGGGGHPIGDYLDLAALARAAERYADQVDGHPAVARAGLLASIARQGFTRKTFPLVADFARLERLFASGMNLTEVPDRFLLLGFITACDPHNFDAAVAVNCGKGELSADGGFVESGAVANVCREARFDVSGR